MNVVCDRMSYGDACSGIIFGAAEAKSARNGAFDAYKGRGVVSEDARRYNST
jgi:hypothetical protein